MPEMPFYGIEGLFKTGNDIMTSERDLTTTTHSRAEGVSVFFGNEVADTLDPERENRSF